MSDSGPASGLAAAQAKPAAYLLSIERYPDRSQGYNSVGTVLPKDVGSH